MKSFLQISNSRLQRTKTHNPKSQKVCIFFATFSPIEQFKVYNINPQIELRETEQRQETDQRRKYRIGEVEGGFENFSAAAGDDGDFHGLKAEKTRKTQIRRFRV